MASIGATSSSELPSNGRRAGSVESGPGLCVRLLQTECIAVAASPSCTEPGACSPAATAIGLPTLASRNRPIGGGLGNHKRSGCGWAEGRTCLRICNGELTADSDEFKPSYSSLEVLALRRFWP